MSIQSFSEELLKNIEAAFAKQANILLNEARQQTGKETYTAGKMDGMSDCIKTVHEVYKLFVKKEEAEPEKEKALY